MIDQPKGGFLQGCGATGPVVLGIEEPGAAGVSWRVFDQPFLVVGRAPGAPGFLNDPAISRRHAYLQLVDGRLFCVDLQSRTGTLWGDEPGVWGWVPRDSGVRIGPFRLKLRDAGAAGPSSRREVGSFPPVPVSRSFDLPNLPEVTL